MGRLASARQVSLVRVDRRFDPLRGEEAFETGLDVATAAEAELERARARAAAEPTKMERVRAYAQTLRMVGRPAEALAEIDRALSRDAGAFTDTEEQHNWLQNERAYLLYDLNRALEARDAFGQAIAAGEGGQWNVSQVINFATMLNAEGRPADALEVIRVVGRASPYGDIWAASVRACASAQLNDAALRDEAMAFLRQHEADNPAALSHSLLCVNDLEGTGALYVRRLADPTLREDALLALQIYRPNVGPALPQLELLQARLAQVRERAEVRAAVERVGRIEELPVTSTYWGDV